MNEIQFTFSDTIAGYVTDYDRESDIFTVKTSDGRVFRIKVKSNTYAQLVRNLGDPYQDATGQMREMLVPGRFVFTYGIFYPGERRLHLRGPVPALPGPPARRVRASRSQDWWVRQIEQLGDFYLQRPVRRRAGRLRQLSHHDHADRRKGQ